jgi:hypothetical protein
MEDTMKANRFKYLILTLLLILLTVLGLAAVMNTGGAGVLAAPTAALLMLDPPEAIAVTGSSTTVDVQLSDISNVYGIEMTMSFDPAILSVVDANGAKPGVQIGPGSCPAPDFEVANLADNGAGALEYAVVQLSPTAPCTGGNVASIEFMCVAGLESEVTTPITITSSLISDPDLLAIPHTTQNGAVRCEANIFFIEGVVELQGWPGGPAGVLVELKDSGGTTVDSAVVGNDGAFGFTGNTGLTYSVVASYDRYLTIEQASISSSNVGEHIDLGTGRLPAGDLNGDGKINILDISGVAGNFGKNAPQTWAP